MNIINQLNDLILRAKEVKTAQVKVASGTTGLDSIPDGTKPATTGAQVAANHSAEKEMYSENMVDTGAKDNQEGASVTASTDGSSAASTNGQEGADGALLSVKKEADNGEEKPQNKIAAARALAAELRKVAEARVSPFDRFLVKAAQASTHPAIKKAMEAADDEALADASADVLMQALESGEISEEEAAQILEEAVSSGAVSDDELQMAMGESAPVDGGAAPAPAAVEETMAVDPAAGVADETLQTKLASANIDPNSDEYLTKLASEYSDFTAIGYALGKQVAQAYLTKKAEEEAEVKEEVKEEAPAEETKEEAPAAKEEVTEEVAEEGAPGGEEASIMEMMGVPAPTSPEEEAALAEVQAELGLAPADANNLMAMEVPPMDKIAAYKAKALAAYLTKSAALKT